MRLHDLIVSAVAPALLLAAGPSLADVAPSPIEVSPVGARAAEPPPPAEAPPAEAPAAEPPAPSASEVLGRLNALETDIEATKESLEEKTAPPAAPPSGPFKEGPFTADLGAEATIEVPAGYVFAGGIDARRVLQQMENPTSGQELGLLAPAEGAWFLVFEFEDIGYVENAAEEDLDADALLEDLKEGTEAANETRREHGWVEMKLTGWSVLPHYDPATKNLEWGILGENTQGQKSVNYNIRILGRRGVMSTVLVGDPEGFDPALAEARKLVSGFAYKAGSDYAAFEDGDKIAEYGLAALVAGGAAAIALKTGFFSKFWKLLVAGAVGLVALLGKLLGKKETATAEAPKS